MRLSDAKRRYLADICAKTVEFVISIVLIGQLVTGRLNMTILLGAWVLTVTLIVVGTWLIPDESLKGLAR